MYAIDQFTVRKWQCDANYAFWIFRILRAFLFCNPQMLVSNKREKKKKKEREYVQWIRGVNGHRYNNILMALLLRNCLYVCTYLEPTHGKWFLAITISLLILLFFVVVVVAVRRTFLCTIQLAQCAIRLLQVQRKIMQKNVLPHISHQCVEMRKWKNLIQYKITMRSRG